MTAHLVLKVGAAEQIVALGPMNSLGRHPDNSIQILDKLASKQHCVIELRGDHYVLRDLGSLNGTFINSVRVRNESLLVDGDEIAIGSTRGIFHCGVALSDQISFEREGAISSVPGSMRPAFPDERLLAHLATDKPIYRPGEILYARAALLDALTRAPAQRGGNLGFEVRSSRGEVVVSRPAPVARGIGAFSWAIPDDVPFGEYALFAHCPAESFSPAEIAFAIRPVRAPLLHLELELARKTYGPGDEVQAALSATHAEGGIAAGAAATFVALVDGIEIHRGVIALDAAGVASSRFRLPTDIAEGQATLTVTAQDGGVAESITRTIRIVLPRLVVALYPEGGDPVVGLPGRVYIEARTPRGAPVAVAGRVLDSTGEIVARFRTEHEGRGRMTLTPTRAGRAYIALLDEPAGLAEIFPLPLVKREGFTLAALDDITGVEEPVRLRVAASSAGKARVTLSVREREVAAVRLDLAAGESREIALTPPGSADGVLRATVFDAAGLPRAERLVFRRPSRGLRVAVDLRSATLAPAPARPGGPPRAGLRAPILLRVKTTDEGGVPCSATVTIAVTDDALLAAIPPRDRPASLVEQVLLGGEVHELADPAAYLGADEAAAHRLDLLLGTQGFRRFAFDDVARFAAEHGDRAERVLGRRRAPSPALAQAALLMPTRASAPRLPAELPAAPRRPRPRHFGAFLRGLVPLPRISVSILPPGWMPERGRRIVPRPAPPLVVVREYAHRAAAPFDGASTDLTETIYWHAGVTTSPSGEAQVTFDLGDAVTTFRARVEAFSDAGALGHGDALLEASRPFSVEPTLPLEATAGDIVEVPIVVTNGTATHADVNVSLGISSGLLTGRDPIPLSLGEGRRERVRIPLAVLPGRGVFPVTVRASAGLRGDEVTRSLTVVPAGFPVEWCAQGRLEPDGVAVHAIRLPDAIEPGSYATELVLHPSPLATLMEALRALHRAPGGCFEQAASTAAVEVMRFQHLLAHPETPPRALAGALESVERSHARLAAFERKEHGFEWFGGAPEHEALTAFGLMTLTAMSEVFPVDAALLSRTRAWLLVRRDGRGGFVQDPRCPGAPPKLVADAYITWALGRAGVGDLDREIAAAAGHALASADAYHLALAAGAALAQRPAGDAAPLLAQLAAKQAPDGAVRGAATSITRSTGEGLVVETTSLAILAWLRAGEPGRAARSVRWLLDRGSGGRFGASHATALALEALMAWAATHARPKVGGTVQVLVDGTPGAIVLYGADTTGPIVVPSFASALGPGERDVTIRMSGGAPMPYTLRIRVNTPDLPGDSAGKVALTTSLDRVEIEEGESITLRAVLANVTGEALPRVTALLGLPAGLEASEALLRELVTTATIDAWELRGRELVLQLRTMAPGERRVVALALRAAIPGSYTGPPSRVYVTHREDEAHWAPALRVRILPVG